MADIKLIETDAAVLYNKVILELEQGCGEPLYPGDERRIFAESLVAFVVQMCNMINDACKQKMLDYARDEVLDALGARTNTLRIQPKYAETTIRFGLNSIIRNNIVIPKGTRVTPDNNVYFATTEAAVIHAGETFVDVPAKAMESGEKYNGYLAGSICQLVDLIPYIDTVSNISATDGGDDGEPYNDEGNAKYRERIRLSVSKITTAGPEESYRFYALSADASIADVSITSPNPGEVKIVPICQGGTIPTFEILEAVNNICSADDIRPMTDKVIVEAPEQIAYDINIKCYITSGKEAECINTIEGAGGAIEQYKTWQDTVMGRDINPDKLRAYVLAPASGVAATRIDVVSPQYTELSEIQVAKCNDIKIEYEAGEE